MKTLNQYITEAMSAKKTAAILCPVVDDFTGLDNGYEKAEVKLFGQGKNAGYYVVSNSTETPNKTNPTIYIEVQTKNNRLYCLLHKKGKSSGVHKTINISNKMEADLAELLPELQKEYEKQYGSTLAD